MRIGVIGVGRMGRRHIQAVRRLGWDLVGLYDVSKDSLNMAQSEFLIDSDKLFDDINLFFAHAKPECLIIATTADSHCKFTCLATENGVKFILVEKPMAVSLEECDRMIEACKQSGVKLAVNHQMRFMEQYTEPKRLFKTKEYDGLMSMTVVAGNFGFAMNGSHYFEAFRFLTEEDIAEVTAWFSPEIVANPRGPQFQDRAGSIRAVTTGGKRLYMEIGSDQGHGIRVVYACRNGMITINELDGDLIANVREEQYRDLPTSRYGMPSVDSRIKIAPCEVVDTSAAVLRSLINNENVISGEDGRRVIEVLVAAYQSAGNGNNVIHLKTGVDRSVVFPWA
ncbi:Gfo/Idh/MocA family protein [Leptospira stimsonii]|nr:Gfo/Idh/MocA family oxidoreductase [Leptospira stimsonii]